MRSNVAYAPDLGEYFERDLLVTEHLEYGERLVKKFLQRWQILIPLDEIHSIVGLSLTEAANNFDSTRGVSFRTFSFYYLKGCLVKEIALAAQISKLHQNIELITSGENFSSEPNYHYDRLELVSQETPEKLVGDKEVLKICFQQLGKLDELEREILIRNVINEESINSIAKEYKYCRSHLSRVKQAALKKMEKLLKERQLLTLSSATKAKKTQRVSAKRMLKKNYKGGRGRKKELQITKEKIRMIGA